MFAKQPSTLFADLSRKILTLVILFLSYSSQAQMQLWSSADTWQGGEVPGIMDTVTIEAEQKIVLDLSPPPLATLIIKGTLIFDNQNLLLTTQSILIEGGKMEVGTPGGPYTHKAIITLIGPDKGDSEFGTKYIAVTKGGKLNLHGATSSTLSWTELAKTAFKGDTTLHLKKDVNWKTGDEIVLAGSGFHPAKSEKAVITNIHNNRVYLSNPLLYDHEAKNISYLGNQLEMKTEVGLLSRNIVIQGDPSSDYSGMGGHIQISDESHAQIEGVEFRWMGQYGHSDRHPLQWNNTGNSKGDYARHNSIYNSFNKGIVVKNARNIALEHNVCFNLFDAAISIEGGLNSSHAKLNHNLGIYVHPPYPHLLKEEEKKNLPQPTAVFYIDALEADIRHNHAAGADRGSGFVLGSSYRSADSTSTFAFSNNTSHSNHVSELNKESDLAGAMGNGLWIEPGQKPEDKDLIVKLRGFIAYKNASKGIYSSTSRMEIADSKFSDNSSGVYLPAGNITKSLFIGKSDNIDHSVQQSSIYSSGVVFAGQGPYSEPSRLADLSFANLTDAAILVEAKSLPSYVYTQKLKLEATKPLRFDNLEIGALLDMDGSLTGKNSLLTGSDRTLHTKYSRFVEEWNAYACNLNDYVYLQFNMEQPADTELKLLGMGGKNLLIGQKENRSCIVSSNKSYSILLSRKMPEQLGIYIEGLPEKVVRLDIPLYAKSSMWIQHGNTIMNSENSLDQLQGNESKYFHDKDRNILHLYLSTDEGSQENMILHKGTPPVGEITGFEVQEHKPHVFLEWQARNNKGFSRYQVMRSTDGKHFKMLAKVDADGNKFQFKDPDPTQSISYYRIDAFHKEGWVVSSPVRSLSNAFSPKQ